MKTRFGIRQYLDCHWLSQMEEAAFTFGTFASIHLTETLATVYGAGGFPGCTNKPGCAFLDVILPAIGTAHDQRGIDLARSDHLVHFRIRVLPKTQHRIPGGLERAFGGLLIGDRLLHLPLRKPPEVR